MVESEIEPQLKRLITGLATEEINKGSEFYYDGSALLPEDVGEIGLPSILCIAEDLSQRLGLGGLGYRFELGEPNPLFPLHAIQTRTQAPRFFEIAPLVTQVFVHDVMECRTDLLQLYERAMKLVDPELGPNRPSDLIP